MLPEHDVYTYRKAAYINTSLQAVCSNQSVYCFSAWQEIEAIRKIGLDWIRLEILILLMVQNYILTKNYFSLSLILYPISNFYS